MDKKPSNGLDKGTNMCILCDEGYEKGTPKDFCKFVRASQENYLFLECHIEEGWLRKPDF